MRRRHHLLPATLLSLGLALPTIALAQNDDASSDLGTVQLEQSQDFGQQKLDTQNQYIVHTALDNLIAAIADQKKAIHPGDLSTSHEPQLTSAIHNFASVATASVANSNYLWFLLQLPATYDSNAGAAPHEAIGSDRFDPKLQLNFSQAIGDHLQFTDISAYDIDRYGRDQVTAAETFQSVVQLNYFFNGIPTQCPTTDHNLLSDVDANMRAEIEKSLSQLKCAPNVSPWAAYLWYQPTIKDNSTFSHQIFMQNDVGGGVSYKQKLDSLWAIGLDLNFTYRDTQPTDSDSLWLRATAQRKFGLADNSNLVLQFAPNFRMRWYDSVAGFARQDETLVVPLILEWDPPANGDMLNKLLPDIQLSLFFAKNYSNGPKYAYEQWNNGGVPELSYIAYACTPAALAPAGQVNQNPC
jgi:hypothetical protein